MAELGEVSLKARNGKAFSNSGIDVNPNIRFSVIRGHVDGLHVMTLHSESLRRRKCQNAKLSIRR